MKLTLLLFATALLLGIQNYAQTGVAINPTGAEADSSAMLDVSSTTKGLLVPRMNEAQRTAIVRPVKGLLVYQNDGTEGFYFYDGSAWRNLSIVNFSESNFLYDSKYGVKLLARNDAQTDVDFVISPKRKGAILVNQPDGTGTGGNNRGYYSVDLQSIRVYADEVASGNASVVIGGIRNKATGDFSVAMGAESVASGKYSVALGYQSKASLQSSLGLGGGNASGYNATAIGRGVTASGTYSFATGYSNTAQSYAETVMGIKATIGSGNIDEFIATDRLFVIGNGTSNENRTNAFTILKNANTTIGGSLTINGNGTNTGYLFPETRGTSGEVLQTDGSGNTSWGSIVGSQWTTSGSNIYYNSGNVGIGNADPTQKLTVEGSVAIPTGQSYWIGNAGDAGNRLRLHQSATNAYIDWGEETLFFRSGASSATNRVIFTGDGQVVIPALSTPGVLLNSASGVISSSVGTNGQVLTTNGSGALSWTTPTAGTVTTVTGTAPIVSSGGTTPVISITAATGSSAGSMSAADKAKLDKYPEGTAAGQMQYWNGTAWVTVAPGTTGQLLSINSSGIPEWKSQLSIITASTLTPSMSSSGVTFNGVVNPNNLYASQFFQYGTTTDYGNTTETTYYTPSSTNNTISSSQITGLSLGTTYHVRLVTQTILGTFYSNDITFTYLYPGAPLYLGATYQEGIVFYLDGTGQHGKVCAFYDQSASATWYDALPLCAAYSSGTVAPNIYDDWYLPSTNDLTLMYNNLKVNSAGSFSNSNYWSFEAFDDTQAFYVDFGNGNVAFGDKNATYKVRAVRDF